MFKSLFNPNEKQLNKLKPIVEEINLLEKEYSQLTDAQLIEKTNNWKEEISKIPEKEHAKYLDGILPYAYALVREASKRALGMRHYDVQLMAGIVLHQGKIAEQKTGEGKTLTATLPLYLNSLTQKGVHLVTPNDYLSRHGAGWMGKLYIKLGLSVGVIMDQRAFVYDPNYETQEFKDEYSKHLKEVPKQQAYKCDIIYGTNHEFGFDYLRDNMAVNLTQMAQTNPLGEFGIHNFAIVDEVDSILIDVARTPLIISSTAAQPTDRYMKADSIVKQLIKITDYDVDEKFKNASLTDLGIRKVENMLGISNLYEQDFEMVHLLEQSLSAHALYEKDKDYVVKDGQVIIVDQFTGRLLPSNRFSHGLHQALEAKEKVEIQQESKTVAEISYQNYFRMYTKLAGMTGTALTEAEEFYKIYELDVVVLPTNKPCIRVDHNDVVYKSEAGKFRAVANEIVERHNKGQPVLVGTTSVEKSELLHDLLKRRGISHEILNAKNHEQEALIIAQAGKKGSVTISTNMAGRGVDIILGGDPATTDMQEEVKSLGGLHVIGTERHDSRRIDNQLRGRSGRQGDPGSSRFYISLQDDLMRIFGGSSVEKLMNRFGIDDSVPMEASLVTKAIENAQKKVEGFNFDRRKQLVEMDDVINVHRDVVYKLRRRILELSAGNTEYKDWFIEKISKFDTDEKAFISIWDKFDMKLGASVWLNVIGQLSLPVVDMLWMEHLVDMDQVRDGIGLRGYAQKDPMVEYKKEGHARFELLVDQIYSNIYDRFTHIEDISPREVNQGRSESLLRDVNYTHGNLESGVYDEKKQLQHDQRVVKDDLGRTLKVQSVSTSQNKIGRNDPCPCGSGKKYKHCGLINAPEHKK